jgi:hypothetical protein
MTYETFKTTLSENTHPQNLHPLLKALWYDFNGDWEAAHEVAQSNEGTADYDHLHAYLHRKEGDNWNANYWYKRAGETMPKIGLEEEWEIIAKKIVTKY